MIKLDSADIFAAFRLPGTKSFFLITQEKKDIPFDIKDIFSKCGFVFFPFDKDNKNAPPLFIEANNIYENKKFSFYTEQKDTNPFDGSKEAYLEKADFFINATRAKFRKLVLSRTKTVKANTIDLYHIFEKAAKRYPQAFVYLLHHPAAGTWMAATPEVLLKKNGDEYTTVALAGTRFVKNPEAVTWSPKELEEHQAVTDFIGQILEKHRIRYHRCGTETKIAAKNNDAYLVHLFTQFNFAGKVDNGGLLLDLHPTPAVSGFPQKEAVQFIKTHEGYDRQYYTGFAGTVNIPADGTFDLFVNLRSMKVFEDSYRLYLGGGLNSKSIPEKEWEETENKAKTLLELIKQ